MTGEELKRKLQPVFQAENTHGITIFACIEEDDRIRMKQLLTTSEFQEDISARIDETIRSSYLSEEFRLESATQIDEHSGAFYEIVQSDEYAPFHFLEQTDEPVLRYSDSDQKNLIGFAFRININSDVVCWVYQKVYQQRLINRSKHIYAIISKGSTYTTLKNDVICFDSRVDLIVVGSSIITNNISLLQRSFKFEAYIRSEAEKTIALISEMNIVDGIEKFVLLKDKEAITNSKKMMKVRNSPVLKMERTTLIARLTNHPRYSTQFTITDGKVYVATQKEALAFIKMLNDDIVRSDLTDAEYDSTSKQRLKPIQ